MQCYADKGECFDCMTVPCIIASQVQHVISTGQQEVGLRPVFCCVAMWCLPCVLCHTRWSMRTKYNISNEGNCISDWVLSLLCPCCVAGQLKRELLQRGVYCGTYNGLRRNVRGAVTE